MVFEKSMVYLVFMNGYFQQIPIVIVFIIVNTAISAMVMVKFSALTVSINYF